MAHHPGQHQSWHRWVWTLYLGAGVNLVSQIVSSPDIAERILAIALLVFGVELAWMARVDLINLYQVWSQVEDSRLPRFQTVVFSTIVLELIGFYWTFRSVAWGAAVIILSQLWFNTLAKVDLRPTSEPPIADFGIADRIPVLAANLLALCTLSLWPIETYSRWSAIGLLSLIALFLLIKYVLIRDSATHTPKENAPELKK